MTRHLFLILLFAGIAALLPAQEIPEAYSSFEKLFSMDSFPDDPSAEAAVIYDIGSSRFVESDNSFDIIFERKVRIKIFSEAGLDWAEVEIPYYHEGNIYEEVFDIHAYTYNQEQGKTVSSIFDPDALQDEKINKFWSQKKMVLPNVKPGSIIEYRYKIRSQYIFNLRDWEFQWRIPVVLSKYQVAMIPFYEYTYLLQGVSRFDEQSSYVDKHWTRSFAGLDFYDAVNVFVMKNVPAFRDEEYITSINDYIIKLDFQLSKIIYPNGIEKDVLTTWEDLNKELLQNKEFGGYLKKSEKMGGKLLDQDALSGKSEEERFDAVLNYVKGNFNWDGINGKYTSCMPGEFYKKKTGNCAELNLFTIGLLRSAGIEAWPVLLSTRSHGKVRYNYPFSHFFNYVIILAKVGDKRILTDATQVYASNRSIPPKCINDRGLIVKNDKVDWVDLHIYSPSEEQKIFKFSLEEDHMNGEVTVTATRYIALAYRDLCSDGNKDLLKKLKKKGFPVIDSSLVVRYQKERERALVYKYRMSCPVDMIGNKIYLEPFPGEVPGDNPLKQKTRTYPIDMIYPDKKTFFAYITIPEGYKTDYTPTPVTIGNDKFELAYSVEKPKEDELVVKLSYYFKKPVYPAKDYALIKSYFNKIVKLGNEKIVLTQK